MAKGTNLEQTPEGGRKPDPISQNEVAYNGQLANVIPVGVAIPRRQEWFLLAPEYGEARFKMWINHPPRLRDQIFTGTSEERRAALTTVLLAHNAWTYMNEDGEQVGYPPMNTVEFWEQVPTDMAVTLILRMREESSALPNSLQATKSTSEPGSASVTPPG